ncbi:MAG TPA: (d)CMP kinase [Candidatus Pelethocola excrementipullorum]|nr:(d)CMP kinase [Candidatus Pelethocola excrementipullorum]
MSINIAIDGPAGAGKSTIAKRVAEKLSFIYVDTGAMYRAMALYMLRGRVDIKDEAAVTDMCSNVHVGITYEDGEQRVLLNEEDVSGLIRSEEVGNAASAVAVYSAVRAKLLELQQSLARTHNVVMDGRDIGSAVLPGAQVKIYLTASVHTRAERRYKELVKKGESPDIQVIEQDIIDRDYQDMHRKISPLCQAEDAVLIDSSRLSIDGVVDRILNIYKERCC